ncbi:hypothetical protein [uncultured Enterovirga sp.]|uniref:hypothetical protein n=1 Tax=uncultured Enterovirga sp. TaxID=2026352 RepID=UPI0035CA6246
MTLMFPPSSHRATALAPVTVARRFRLHLRCTECAKETYPEIELLDEPHDPATEDDFYASGAVNKLEPCCERCGGGGVTILRITYIRKPIDA